MIAGLVLAHESRTADYIRGKAALDLCTAHLAEASPLLNDGQ
jgi:hypothetical protein